MTPGSVDLHDAVSNVAYFIQLSVAPVFLLTGVGAMLSVLTNRLSRIIDRARVLEGLYETEQEAGRRASQHALLRVLSRRARLVSWSISCVRHLRCLSVRSLCCCSLRRCSLPISEVWCLCFSLSPCWRSLLVC